MSMYTYVCVWIVILYGRDDLWRMIEVRGICGGIELFEIGADVTEFLSK